MSSPVPRTPDGTVVSRYLVQLIHALTVVLALRAILIFVGVNVEQPVVAALLAFTDPLAGPFEGIFPQPADAAGVLPVDLGAIIACGALEAAGFALRNVARRVAAIP